MLLLCESIIPVVVVALITFFCLAPKKVCFPFSPFFIFLVSTTLLKRDQVHLSLCSVLFYISDADYAISAHGCAFCLCAHPFSSSVLLFTHTHSHTHTHAHTLALLSKGCYPSLTLLHWHSSSCFRMSSSLTFQLRQQQQQEQQQKLQQHQHQHPSTSQQNMVLAPSSNDGLPSPPNSSYGDETTTVHNDLGQGGVTIKEPLQERRDSLPTHFNALTLEHFSTSLPENYTIEHSSAPIPITSSNQHQSTTRRVSESRQHSSIARSSSGSPSPMFYLGSPTATAAATGGRTIRNNARFNNHANNHIASTSLPVYTTTTTNTSHPHHHHHHSTTTTTANNITSASLGKKTSGNKVLHRCEDCGKVYKHYNCLAKHRWEHSEEWELTSKLLLTKHQQVQMLEAAAILVSLDTQRVEQEQQKLQQQQQQLQLQQQKNRHASSDEDDEDDDQAGDDESIHITDDDDDIIVDMEMDDVDTSNKEPSSAYSPASSSTTISIASPSTTSNHINNTTTTTPSSQSTTTALLSNGHA